MFAVFRIFRSYLWIACAILTVVTVALWISSYRINYLWQIGKPCGLHTIPCGPSLVHLYFLDLSCGRAHIGRLDTDLQKLYEGDFAKNARSFHGADWPSSDHAWPLPVQQVWEFMGLRYVHGDVAFTRVGRGRFGVCQEGCDIVSVPFWMVFVGLCACELFLCRSAIRWARYRRRIKNNLCVHCGYDLRASKDRCPECGTPFSSSAPSAAASPPDPRL